MIAISNEPVQVHLVGRSRSDKLSIARPTPALLYHACKILENQGDVEVRNGFQPKT